MTDRPIRLHVKPSFQIVPLPDGVVCLYSRTGESFRIKGTSFDLRAALERLKGGVAREELLAEVAVQGAAAAADLERLLVSLQKAGALLQDAGPSGLSPEEEQWFSRALGWFSEHERPGRTRYDALRAIRSAHVVLLGVGGLGSWVLQHLVASGVGRVTGVDMDRIEVSNLGRQSLYRHDQRGESKVAAAAAAVRALSPYTTFCPVDRRVTGPEDILSILKSGPRADLIVLTADEPVWGPSVWTSKAAARAGVPLLRGNSQAIGPLFIPGQTSCPACEWRRAKEEIPGAREIVEYYRSERRGRGYGAALSTTIAWSSTLLAHEALVFLSGLPPPRTRNAKVSVSLDDPLSAKVTPCPVDPGCEACGPR